MQRNLNPFEWLKKLSTGLAAAIGFATTVIGFVNLLRGNYYLGLTILGILAVVALLLLFAYLAFAKTPSPIVGGRLIYRYPRFRLPALIGICLILVFVAATLAFAPGRSFIITAFVGSATPITRSTPIQTLTVPVGVQTVRVEDPRAVGPSRGFFTTRGYIIAFVIPDSTNVSVVWRSDGQEWQGQAQVIDRGGLYVPDEISLLKLANISPPQVALPIRLSASLKFGDFVERYITPQDRTPGSVLEVNAQREIMTGGDKTVSVDRALITTYISASTDAGAPVLDTEGNVVGMVYGGSQGETVSISIDWIKASFSRAFE